MPNSGLFETDINQQAALNLPNDLSADYVSSVYKSSLLSNLYSIR